MRGLQLLTIRHALELGWALGQRPGFDGRWAGGPQIILPSLQGSRQPRAVWERGTDRWAPHQGVGKGLLQLEAGDGAGGWSSGWLGPVDRLKLQLGAWVLLPAGGNLVLGQGSRGPSALGLGLL